METIPFEPKRKSPVNLRGARSLPVGLQTATVPQTLNTWLSNPDVGYALSMLAQAIAPPGSTAERLAGAATQMAQSKKAASFLESVLGGRPLSAGDMNNLPLDYVKLALAIMSQREELGLKEKELAAEIPIREKTAQAYETQASRMPTEKERRELAALEGTQKLEQIEAAKAYQEPWRVDSQLGIQYNTHTGEWTKLAGISGARDALSAYQETSLALRAIGMAEDKTRKNADLTKYGKLSQDANGNTVFSILDPVGYNAAFDRIMEQNLRELVDANLAPTGVFDLYQIYKQRNVTNEFEKLSAEEAVATEKLVKELTKQGLGPVDIRRQVEAEIRRLRGQVR